MKRESHERIMKNPFLNHVSSHPPAEMGFLGLSDLKLNLGACTNASPTLQARNLPPDAA